LASFGTDVDTKMEESVAPWLLQVYAQRLNVDWLELCQWHPSVPPSSPFEMVSNQS